MKQKTEILSKWGQQFKNTSGNRTLLNWKRGKTDLRRFTAASLTRRWLRYHRRGVGRRKPLLTCWGAKSHWCVDSLLASRAHVREGASLCIRENKDGVALLKDQFILEAKDRSSASSATLAPPVRESLFYKVQLWHRMRLEFAQWILLLNVQLISKDRVEILGYLIFVNIAHLVWARAAALQYLNICSRKLLTWKIIFVSPIFRLVDRHNLLCCRWSLKRSTPPYLIQFDTGWFTVCCQRKCKLLRCQIESCFFFFTQLFQHLPDRAAIFFFGTWRVIS